MIKKLFVSCGLILYLFLPCVGNFDARQPSVADDKMDKEVVDRVLWIKKPNIPVNLVAALGAPNPMCNIVTLVPCNYIIPPNDYVTFSTNIVINNCPVNATYNPSPLNTVTLTFAVAPTVPIFVWLTSATTATTPVYMNNASITISKTAFPNWFTASTTWTNLCVQAIYPNPPPTTLYYPMSCTIVYQ